jgi:hypothetical protein
MDSRFALVLSLALLFCIVALVVSPAVDLPVTALKSARIDLHVSQLCARLVVGVSCLSIACRLGSIEPVQAFQYDAPATSDELRC